MEGSKFEKTQAKMNGWEYGETVPRDKKAGTRMSPQHRIFSVLPGKSGLQIFNLRDLFRGADGNKLRRSLITNEIVQDRSSRLLRRCDCIEKTCAGVDCHWVMSWSFRRDGDFETVR